MMVIRKEKLVAMKRIFMVALVAFCALFASNSYADDYYPKYLNNNPNLIFTDGHMDAGFYYDKSSVVNVYYNPPYYKIAVNVVYVYDAGKGNTQISNVSTEYFTYDYENRTLDVASYSHSTGKWHYTSNLKPSDNRSRTMGTLYPAQLAFFQIYGLKFFDLKYLNYKAVL